MVYLDKTSYSLTTTLYMISMAVLTPFFDVVAGVAILAGRSSLLDTGIFKTANTNFTIRHLLALGFIGYGGWNLWKIERAQDKLKKTLDAESFSADYELVDYRDLGQYNPLTMDYIILTSVSHGPITSIGDDRDTILALYEELNEMDEEELLEYFEESDDFKGLSVYLDLYEEKNAESFSAQEAFKPESNFVAIKELEKNWKENHSDATWDEMLSVEIGRLRNRLIMKGYDPDAKIGSPYYAESFAAEDKCDCGADLQYMSGDLLDDGNFLEGWLCQNPDCGEWYNAEESFGAEEWRTRLNVCDSCGFSDYDDEVVWRIDGMCRNCKSMSGAESFEAAQYIEMDCDPHHKWKLNDTPYIDYGDGSSGYIELSVRCQNCGEERFGSYSIDGNEPCALNLSKKGVKPRYYRWGAESFALETVRVEGADPTMFYTILTAHENICHPDGEECCDECLLLNGFDISEEIGREFTN